MAKRKRGKGRPFRPEALAEYANPVLRPRMGPGETLWRYTVTVPLEEIRPIKRQIATDADLSALHRIFLEHFDGYTRLPESLGFGLRDPANHEEAPEMNIKTFVVVLATPVPESEAYFRALREELESALDEGVILVERQQVWIP